jgi:GNAT superfamily N-acetyltransferase
MKLEIADRISPEDLGIISGELAATGAAQAPPYFKHELAVLCRLDDRLVGGLYGTTNWSWLHIGLLWVSPAKQNSGLGSALMAAAEKEARRRGCHSAYVSTYSFQAQGFYEKLGYTIFGRLDDFPPGHQRLFLEKKLVSS